MIIQTLNILDNLPTTQYSYLSANIVTGASTAPIKNINNFTASYAVQFGNTGEAQSEINLLGTATPSGTALILAGTTVYNHSLDTPVFNVIFDKIIFKRLTDGTAGTATGTAVALTGGTINITPNSLFTEFNDSTGVNTYAYKTQYYNSVTTDVSSESDWFIPGGPTFYSLQKLRDRVKNRLYNANYIKSDDVINEWINEWMEEMNTAAIKVNKGYLMGTTSLTFGTAGLGTITASDFMYPNKIEITQDGVNYIPTTLIPVNEWSDSDYFSPNAPRHSWTGDTTIQFLPAGQSGTAKITYSKGNPILVNDADELPYPMRRYTRTFINYGLYCAYENDQKPELTDTNYQKAEKGKADFINEITPRDQTGPQFINLAESLSGRNDGMGFEDDYIV